MNSNFIFGVLFLLVRPCVAQVVATDDSLAKLLRTWRTDYGHFNKLKRFEKTSSSFYIQTMAGLNALYSNFDSAIAQFNRVSGYMRSDSDTISFATYSNCKSVVTWLDSVSQKQQIIIVNEAHHRPKHRIITKEYLEILYKNGYRYLGLEALGNNDSLLHTRKYALASKAGYLIKEPCYGDLVRQALNIGFTLFGYDAAAPDMNGRELGQAQNIIERTLKVQPNAKVLIHCGFSHGLRTKTEAFAMMGFHLEKLSGITPFVINQEGYDENTNPIYEKGAYRYFELKVKFKEPVVFLNATGKVYRVNADGDAAVFLPRSIYQNGRPHWLNLDQKKVRYPIDLSNIQLQPPFLVQAFLKKEGLDAIPVDQVEIHSLTEAKDLILYPDTYLLVILDREGTKISTQEINITN